MFDQKKCIEALVVYLIEVNAGGEAPLELYLSNGEKIKVKVLLPKNENKNGNILFLKSRTG